jgi:hypothetical protein
MRRQIGRRVDLNHGGPVRRQFEGDSPRFIEQPLKPEPALVQTTFH